MRRPRLALLLLLPCALPSCSSPPAPVLVRDKPPAQLLSCAAQPEPPGAAALDAPDWDKAYGLYVTDLKAAGEDCRDRLGTLRDLLNR